MNNLKKLFALLLIPNIVLARNEDQVVIGILVIGAILIYIFFSGSKTNTSPSSIQKKDGFLAKKRIDENIKLVLQNTYASMFFFEQAKLSSNPRTIGEENEAFDEMIQYGDIFLDRDLTYDEIDSLLKINMDYRRKYDAINQNKALGKFDNVMNPSIAADGKNWSDVIEEFKLEMKWHPDNENINQKLPKEGVKTNFSNDNETQNLAQEIHSIFHKVCDILEKLKEETNRQALVKLLNDSDIKVDEFFMHEIKIITSNSHLAASITLDLLSSQNNYQYYSFIITGIFDYQGLNLTFDHKDSKRKIYVIDHVEAYGLDQDKFADLKEGAKADELFQEIIKINGGKNLEIL
jgi:hypothetical protein